METCYEKFGNEDNYDLQFVVLRKLLKRKKLINVELKRFCVSQNAGIKMQKNVRKVG